MSINDDENIQVHDKDTNIEGKKEEKNNQKIQVIINCLDEKITREEIEKIGTIIYALPMINAYVVEIQKTSIQSLERLNGVIKVEQDNRLSAQMKVARETVGASWREEESRLGEGIGVAVLDTGVYPHFDLTKSERLVAFKDFVNHEQYAYDDNGHGTHVAGIIGGDGYESEGVYRGIATKANIIGIKVLDKNGSGNISDVLAGVQWVLDNKERYNIRIINLSVGMLDVDGEDCALIKGVEAAWNHHLFVFCAAGNNGPSLSTITTPGVSRKVITVGSSDDVSTVTIADDKTIEYSSRGPTKSCIKKPDIVAPGSNIISCHTDVDYRSKKGELGTEKIGYIKKSGTSMSTPILSGITARLLSDFPTISNVEAKIALKYSTVDLGYEQSHQGWGMINVKSLYHNITNILKNKKDL